MNQKLTPKERLLRTMKRQEIDRLPTQIDFSGACLDKMLKHWGLASEPQAVSFLGNHIVYAYLNDAVGNIKARQLADSDLSFDSWGVGYSNGQEGPLPVVHPLADMDQWAGYEFPDPNADGLLARAEKVVATYGQDYLVTSYQIYCIFERAWTLRGFDNFLMDFYLNPDFAGTLLDRITDYQVAVAKRYVKLGVGCGRTGDDYGGKTGMLFSPAMWREFIKPRLKRVWQVYQEAGIPVMHHSCGDILPIIPDFIEMGLSILNPIQPDAMDITTVKEQFGEALTFYGGISTAGALAFGTPEQVKEDVRQTAAILGKGGGYLIAPAQGITSEVSVENIEAFRQAVGELAGSF
ncbi:MAG: uroporphyrinogen decarboxylase family protein [Negativicutes bacterium]|nr:uroporphyrinogen decarboxylase family protein [Negativicutes bacterium]